MKVVITASIKVASGDLPALKAAGAEELIQTARMQGAKVDVSITPEKHSKASKNPPQGSTTQPNEKAEDPGYRADPPPSPDDLAGGLGIKETEVI